MDHPLETKPIWKSDDKPPPPTEAELKALMDESDADVEAGNLVEAAPLLASIRAQAEQTRQERLARSKGAPATA